jgi:hypothetical protein
MFFRKKTASEPVHEHPRREKRVPMEVGVHIGGHGEQPGVETTFTENVSERGARVISARRWQIDDQITIATLTGSFRSVARVAYCELVRGAGFVVGIEFVETQGNWILGHSSY